MNGCQTLCCYITLRWGRCRASLTEVIPCLRYSASTSTIWSTVQMAFVVMIAGSEWMKTPCRIPSRRLHQSFLAQAQTFGGSTVCYELFTFSDIFLIVHSPLPCLVIAQQFLSKAGYCTVVIILKYHGTFHEQAYSYFHNLPVKLQFSEKLLLHLRNRHVSVLWSFLANITLSAALCSQVMWIYFSSLWMLIVLFHICFPTLQYSTPPISLEAGAAMASLLLHAQQQHWSTVPVRAVEKWDIQMMFGPKTHHVFLERQRARKCLSAPLPVNKCKQKGAAHCGGFPRGRTCWLVKTKSADSNWSHSAWWAYWTRSCWTAVLWCALVCFIYFHFERFPLCGAHQPEIIRL